MGRHRHAPGRPDRRHHPGIGPLTHLIDARALQDGSAVRGIGTYVRGLLGGLHELGAGGDVELLLRNGPLPPEVATLGLAVAAERLPALRRRIQPLADPLLIAAALRRLRPALYHAVEYGQPLMTASRVVATVHDLIPFRFPRLYAWSRRERLLPLQQLRRADAVIAVSEATARDLVLLAGVDRDRITVIHHGVNPALTAAPPGAVSELRARLGVTRPYLLAVGTFDPRKRIELLAGVAATVAAEHDVDLVVAGSQGNFEPAVRSALGRPELAGRVHLLGYAAPADLPALYTGARCLLFTSAYEGFGLPILEAMACGTPVATFDNSSLPEVAGEAAIVVEDGDAQAMAREVTRLLGDAAEAARLARLGSARAAEFTWRRTAASTLDVYRHVLEGGGK